MNASVCQGEQNELKMSEYPQPLQESQKKWETVKTEIGFKEPFPVSCNHSFVESLYNKKGKEREGEEDWNRYEFWWKDTVG